MNEDDAEIIKAAAEGTAKGIFGSFNQLMLNLLGPLTEEMGLDWRERYRAFCTGNTVRILAKVQDRFDAAQIEPHPVPPKLLAEVLQNGSLEEDDSLQDRWAALLIHATPIEREEQLMLNSAPDILKQLNKWEAMLLDQCMFALKSEDYIPLPVPENRSQLATVYDWGLDLRNNCGFDRSGMRYSIDFGIMIQNLIRLRLLKAKEENGKEVDIVLTTLGYHFMLLCNVPRPWVEGPPPKSKVYLIKWLFRDEGDGEIQCHYSAVPQGATGWETPEHAVTYVREINEKSAAFNSDDPQKLTNYTIEKRDDGKFVVGCEM